jgi:hypothetical protein
LQRSSHVQIPYINCPKEIIPLSTQETKGSEMLPLFGKGNLQYLAATKIAAGWLNRVKKIKLQ